MYVWCLNVLVEINVENLITPTNCYFGILQLKSEWIFSILCYPNLRNFIHPSLLLHWLLPAWANCAKLLAQNHFVEPNQHVLTFIYPILIWRATYCKQVNVLLVNTVFVFCNDSNLNIIGYKGVFVAQNISMLVPFSRDGPTQEAHSIT
jgi:hypothetical protein